MPESHEEIGVSLQLDRKGRMCAYRIFLNEGVVVKREVLTEGRNQSKALEEARQSLELILHDHGRRLIEFTQPEPAKMRVEHK